jgi:hypothetical protein
MLASSNTTNINCSKHENKEIVRCVRTWSLTINNTQPASKGNKIGATGA